MTQLRLPVTLFVNRGLFRDHYLLTRLASEAFWRTDVEPTRREVAALLNRVEPLAPVMNEATLENDLVRPILQLLGFPPATWVEKQFAAPTDAPDYTIFPSEERRREALTVRLDQGTFFEHATCLVEAKPWDVNLDRAAGRERSPMAQLKRYLVESGVTWGVLTNGHEWRLLARDGPLDVYYGVSITDLARRADGTFRYFTLLFGRDAFAAKVPSRVRAESLRYAEGLEDDLRDRVRDALEALGRGLLAGERIRRGDPVWTPDPGDLRLLFDCAMLVLYRCLFALYAEARRLLPVDSDAYRVYSFDGLVGDVIERVGPTREAGDFAALSATTGTFFERARQLWTMIEHGEGTPGAPLFVPRYNGGLFKHDMDPARPLAQAARRISDPSFRVPDRWFAEVVDIVARIEQDGRLDRLDYAELRERQLGSIYEGLLELEFRVADRTMAAVARNGKETWLSADQVRIGPACREKSGDSWTRRHSRFWIGSNG